MSGFKVGDRVRLKDRETAARHFHLSWAAVFKKDRLGTVIRKSIVDSGYVCVLWDRRRPSPNSDYKWTLWIDPDALILADEAASCD
jgi:hypothetical protein